MNKLKYIIKTALLSLIFIPIMVSGAQIYLLPQTGEVEEGDTIISELRLNTEGEQINAVDIEIIFSSEILEVVEVIEGKSFIDLWIQKPSFGDGKIIIQGGKTNGFSGEGLLLQIIFKGKAKGRGNISFNPLSKVLLNDGLGTPVEGVFSGALYTIKDKKPQIINITSETHPNSEEWFNGKSISVSWQSEENYSYSYTLTKDIAENPDDEVEEFLGPIIFDNPSDGLYYFSIKKLSNDNKEWSPIVRYKFLQDKTAPETFEILFGQDDNVYDGRNFVVFGTIDKTSGIDHYEIREFGLLGFILGKGKWKIAKSPYPLVGDNLRDIIEVKAIDKASNERIEKFIPIVIQILRVVIITTILVLVFLIRRFRRKKRI